MDYKKILLVWMLVGMVSAYNVIIEPNLSDASKLLTNATYDAVNSVDSVFSSSLIQLLIVAFIVFLGLFVVYFLLSLLWRWIR